MKLPSKFMEMKFHLENIFEVCIPAQCSITSLVVLSLLYTEE